MDWQIQIKDQTYVIKLPTPIPKSRPFQAMIGEEVFEITWTKQSLCLRSAANPEVEQHILLRSFSVQSSPDTPSLAGFLEACQQGVARQTLDFQAALHQPGLASRRQAAAATDVALRSPMTGKVIKVLVNQGDEVEKGDLICVVEAMKMENRLTAPQRGVIADLQVKEGDQVLPQALICKVTSLIP